MLSENKINHFFFLAKNACLYSDNKKTRVGCIIVYKNSVISVGYNKNSKTHPLQKNITITVVLILMLQSVIIHFMLNVQL